jgi:hypothetical protein
MKSVAKQVARLLDADPYIKQSLKLGVANYSAIAKKLRKEHLQKASLEAVKAAVRRYSVDQDSFDYVKDLGELLSKTKISLKSDMCVLTLFPDTRLDLESITKKVGKDFSIVRSTNAITVMLEQEHLDDAMKLIGRQNVIKTTKNHYALTLQSPKGIEATPGFVAFFSELLARNGINVLEYYSCYTDTVFILAKKDALKAYSLFDRVLGQEL